MMHEGATAGRRGMALSTKILIGLVVGGTLGAVGNAALGPDHPQLAWVRDNVAWAMGKVFLRLLFMVVVPLVFSSLILGVAGLGDLRSLGRVGVRTLGYFALTTVAAAVLGLVLVNTVRPGHALSRETAEQIREEYRGQAAEKLNKGAQFSLQTIVEFIPENVVKAMAEQQMLAIIVFALLVGIAATSIAPQRVRPFLAVLEGLYEICVVIIRMTMRLAPYAVAALVFGVTAKFGTALLRSLALYLVVVLGGLIVHQFLVLGLCARVFGGVSPMTFFARTRGLMATAFSLSSSSATLPTTIRTAETEFGVPKHVAGFVLPLGATLNMNGTALFEGVSILFLAQVAGVPLDLVTQATVLFLVVISAVGAAGVPGGSLPLVAIILVQIGVPAEMLGVILGVDRLVDMARTVPNVTSDVIAAMFVARTEGSRFVDRNDGATSEAS